MSPAFLLAVGLASAPVAASVPSADGVPIRYEVRGKGSPAIVLVHCWSCDRHLWDHAAARLARDHRVVTLDLAGHGESGRARKAWTIEAFGEDVRAVVEALGLDRVILVGHSMGGPVILEAARRLPGRVVGLVPIDTLQDVEDKTPPDQIAAFTAPFRVDFPGAAAGFIRKYMFVPKSDPALIERIVKKTIEAPPDIAIACLEAAFSHDNATALEQITVPIRSINAERFPTRREANRRHAPQFDVVLMSGVGHYLMLEDPDRFDGLLVGVLREVAAESGAAAVLRRQTEAWNRGDLEDFCSVYDEDASFASPSGLTRGRAAVLERYRKRYPDRAAMGTLRLEVLHARAATDPGATGEPVRPAGVTMVARWRLTYPEKPETSGLTLLVLRPRGDGWEIVEDASF
jgi:pimeloyl-ACP methyl ester carboxylesterase